MAAEHGKNWKYRQTPSGKRTRRREHAAYYSQVPVGDRIRQRWTAVEDELVLLHEMPDSQLALHLQRSIKAIHVRRARLKKAESDGC